MLVGGGQLRGGGEEARESGTQAHSSGHAWWWWVDEDALCALTHKLTLLAACCPLIRWFYLCDRMAQVFQPDEDKPAGQPHSIWRDMQPALIRAFMPAYTRLGPEDQNKLLTFRFLEGSSMEIYRLLPLCSTSENITRLIAALQRSTPTSPE